ncbi:DUF1801 domain-containing protein [uncultured Arcticibacterium sp.]|uniref:DUF1801 domain-containing protein n=1 Tax=uncultured Arcticibacterium sp. TaxID=2173042 RepID=UPI0030FAA3A3
MTIDAKNPDDYISKVPEERISAMTKLRNVILENIPEGFEECMNYGMIGYVVPHSIFPLGYHCDPKLPLPFMNIASQKNFVAVYHSGIYADPELMDWFVKEYPKYNSRKLDMGKSCIRFKKPDEIPFELIGQLASKMTVNQWIEMYQEKINQPGKKKA